jgi:hypothetical protein
MKYVAPESGLKSFTCPHCGVLARQYHWTNAGTMDNTRYADFNQNPVRVSKCENCERICLWHFADMAYPNRGGAPQPNPDMPEDIKKDYEEAAAIHSVSPRGAAALLRLAIQKLCAHLGGSGQNINRDIASLVDNGLSPVIQQSLDVVRVTGNNAVHPGQINTDDPEVAAALFPLVNLIVEQMISIPNQVNNLYGSLPESSRQAIARRDGSTPAS